jgi:hypothetical protein
VQLGLTQSIFYLTQANCKEELNPNGSFLLKESNNYYLGQWGGGQPNGLGILVYGKGGIFQGQFRRGVPDGRGVKVSPDLTVYVGSRVFFL